MKKIAIVLALVATLTSNGAYAQTPNTKPANGKVGTAAQAGTYSANNFAWGIGLGALAVIGIVVGLTAGTSSSSPSTFSGSGTSSSTSH